MPGKTIEVFNKQDAWQEAMGQDSNGGTGIYISAKHRKGIADVQRALFDKATDGKLQTENTIVTNARHFAALEQVAASLRDIQAGY
jgi:tRNA modification GTPase